jgi:DMSO/TMAO reductase YedYZ molybdopterin-dependent catalytic subunit
VGVTHRWYPALAGVASASVALGIGELVAIVVSVQSAPLVVVGGAVIDQVPEWAKELAIRLFGTNDKIALQVGTAILLLAFAAGIGLLAARRLWAGLAGIAAFGLVGVVAALTRADASISWAVPSAVGAGAAAGTLWWLLRLAGLAHTPTAAPAATPTDAPVRTPTAAPAAMDGGVPRRTLVRVAGGLIGGAAVVGYAGRYFAQQTSVDTARRAVVLPSPSGPPAVAPVGADVADLAYVTPNDRFYQIDIALVSPRVNPETWTLKIHGRVARPLTLTFDDLLRRPMIERYITLACVSNEVGGDLIGNARWLGTPLGALLDEVGPLGGADQVVSRSVDGFTAGTPTAVLRDGRDAMIAIGMNGEPLPIDHGFPARLVVPGVYGYVSATKWVREIELTSFADYDAYWIPRGWAREAPIKTQSRIDRPRAGDVVPVGPVTVAGVAWAQHRGISRVEVSVDDGAWQAATLASTASIDTWRLWSWTWNATPGAHQVRVRAADNAGELQSPAYAPPAPDGATGYHIVEVTAE